MDNKLIELELFLNSVINNYPPLSKATNIEDRLDRAVAYRELLADYKTKAHLKVSELFNNRQLDELRGDIQRLANDCLRNYYNQPMLI